MKLFAIGVVVSGVAFTLAEPASAQETEDPFATVQEELAQQEQVQQEPASEEAEQQTLVEVELQESEAEQCFRERDELASVLTSTVQQLNVARDGCQAQVDTAVEDMTERLAFCESDERQNRRTNIALNNALNECKAGVGTGLTPQEDETPPDPTEGAELPIDDVQPIDPDAPSMPEELSAIQNQLAEALAQIRALEDEKELYLGERAELIEQRNQAIARLNEIGAGMVAGYEYFGGDPYSSARIATEVIAVFALEEVLSTAQCVEALEWLSGQQGENRPVSNTIWAQENGRLVICSELAGDLRVTVANPADEAQLVIFR